MLDNSGKLKVNENEATDTSPTHTGYIVINGETFNLKGWIKSDKDGKEYIHIAAFNYNKF